MTLPANIRVNVGAPFPALVKGTAGIALARANGIWTLGLSYMQFGVQTPPASDYASDYLLVYDSVAKTFFRVPLGTVTGAALAQRAVTTAPVTVGAKDQILHLNLTSSATITLPSYLVRSGVPLLFKDVGMQAAVNNITITAAAGEFIDGVFNTVTLNQNGQAIHLVPANDGVNTGWFRE